jgi:hypothetical protein
MTTTSVEAVDLLVQEGRAAALAGDRFAARERFRRATELEPESAEAWFGLSGVVPILAEKRACLQRALALDPGMAEAQVYLADVERLLAQGLSLAPAQRSGDAAPAPDGGAEPSAAPARCYRHPRRETGLRCIQCGRPICGQCVQMADVGQLCPDCRFARRPRNYQVSAGSLIAAGLLGLVAGLVGAALVVLVISPIPLFGLILTLLAGPFSGELTVRLCDRLTHAKRGRPMQLAVGLPLALGGLPLLLPLLFAPSLLTLLLAGYLALAVSSAVARLR